MLGERLDPEDVRDPRQARARAAAALEPLRSVDPPQSKARRAPTRYASEAIAASRSRHHAPSCGARTAGNASFSQ